MMGGPGGYAWITSVSTEDHVDNALILGISLRRVCTAFRLVAIAGSLRKASRDKLDGLFDLIVDYPEKKEVINREITERQLKAHAFSLGVFEKCAYLAPTMMVLKNFDHILDTRIINHINLQSESEDDPLRVDAYLFQPTKGSNKWMPLAETEANDEQPRAKLRMTSLGEQFIVSVVIGMDGKVGNSEVMEARVVNFVDAHPVELWKGGIEMEHLSGVHSIDKLAVASCLSIISDMKGPITFPRGGSSEPVAVVGLSFRLPGANSEEEFWKLLVEGREGVRPVPPHRWTPQHSRHSWRDFSKVEAGFLNASIDEFDAKFFGISPKEAATLDPQQRLLLETSWEALEDAGIDPLSLHGSRAGVFVGSWQYDYHEVATSAPDSDFFRTYMGNSIATQSARLSHFLGCTGPSISTESGCSSSIVAVDLAVKSLRRRESSLALACGVNLILDPFNYKLIEGVLSPTYRCRTFDAAANGFARAEGVTTLVLKRLSDALSSGDRIWGLIRGTGIAQEGLSKSLGTPTIRCEATAMRLALDDAGLDGGDVDYVEAHGTGTPLGDPLEVAAIAKAYRSPATERTQPLLIGSVKTNIGHAESASGIAGMIKVLLAMKHEIIPPHRNLENLNPEISLDVIPARIPDAPLPWPKTPNRRRMAGVSSFGITGTDGHVILEEPPANHVMTTPSSSSSCAVERPLHILKLSAKCPESFDMMVSGYETLLNSTGSRFEDICYSANSGRATFSQKAFVVASDSQEAGRILKDRSFPTAAPASNVTGSTGICFLFTGQGSQYPGMASELYSTSPVFRLHFDRVTAIFEGKHHNISIKDVMWGSSPQVKKLRSALFSQTSIFCVEYALLKLWESWGVKPDYVLGHSLGEFAAAVAAGILELEDAANLVAVRSRLIEDLPPGKMLVVKGDKEAVEEMVTKFQSKEPHFWADFAALNSPEQTVLAGEPGMIEEFARFCSQAGLKTVVLASSHAFHSRHMEPILDAYGEKALASVRQPSFGMTSSSSPKYISGVEGRIVEPKEVGMDYWIRHTREKVNFIDACKTAKGEGITIFLEIGPHPVLSALAMRNLEGTTPTSCLPSLRRNNGTDWAVLLNSLGSLFLSDWKGSINWAGVELGYHSRNRVSLPFYPFNRKSVWQDVRPEQALLHPLLGRKHQTATRNQFVYENELTLKPLPYLQDHVIGNTIIFPGAGYLEMCLAAGAFASAIIGKKLRGINPRRPIGLEHLKILSPMKVGETGQERVQTVVRVVDGELSVQICRLQEDDDSWMTHASSRFLPAVAARDVPEQLDIASARTTGEPWEPQEFYQQLPHLGLKFGPTFHSLEAGWKKTPTEMLFKVKCPQEDKDEDEESYLIHPIVADAMIQAAMVCEKESAISASRMRSLKVPVAIGEFLWLRHSDNPERYIHCGGAAAAAQAGKVSCTLVDGQGRPMALMRSVEFVDTNVKLVEGLVVATGSNEELPRIWEEIYKSSGPKTSPLQDALDLTTARFEFSSQLKADLEEYNKYLRVEEAGSYKELCEVARLYFLNALYSLGWRPQAGEIFSAGALLDTLGIQQGYRHYVNFFLASLAEVGILEKLDCKLDDVDVNNFRFAGEPLSREEIEGRLAAPKINHLPEAKVVREIGKHYLSSILAGRVEPLALLFPEDQSKPKNAALFYQAFERHHAAPLRQLMERVVLPQIRDRQPGTFRLLEIGAGTGSFSRILLNILEGSGIPFEYHYTDISASYFAQAEKAFGSANNNNIIFKRLDMEEDPLTQGFLPEYFDMLYAGEVLHVAKDLKQTLSRLRLLLKPGGLFQIVETLVPDPRITFVFGLLEGYWQFTDVGFRRTHTTCSAPMWEEALSSASFRDVVITPVYMGVHGLILAVRGEDDDDDGRELKSSLAKRSTNHTWIVFRGDDDDCDDPVAQDLEVRLARLSRKVVNIFKRTQGNESEIELKKELTVLMKGVGASLEGVLYLWGLPAAAGKNNHHHHHQDQGKVSLPLVTLCQVVSQLEVVRPPRVVVVTQGVFYPVQEDSLAQSPRAGTLTGIIRSIRSENNKSLPLLQVDLSPEDCPISQLSHLLPALWTAESPPPSTLVLRRGGTSVLQPKLVGWKPQNMEYLPLPVGCTRFQLLLPKTRLISDLEFTFLDTTPRPLTDDQVEVEVKAVALNFRDVFSVLKPIPAFEKLHAVGMDLAGVVTKLGPHVLKSGIRKVGDRVIWMSRSDTESMSSHRAVRASHTLLLPEHMTFSEGATLPTVFSTVYYSLFKMAGLASGETLLVHTASGGVGLAAIQIAREVGAVRLIATAGSPRKRQYLRNLGVEHVFDSRSLGFGKEVLRVTGGRGVDIVLNSLTGPGFKEESLGALAEHGRFVEISKLNVWSVEEVRERRPDVLYSLVDLGRLEESEYAELTGRLERALEQKLVQPIPHERFDALNIRGALNYLQTAKHIGKIVCVMPELGDGDGGQGGGGGDHQQFHERTPLFNEHSTYLVTGGLGGIGFEVVRWILASGGKHVVIASRSSPKPEVWKQLQSWNNANGKHVQAFEVDVGNYEQCRAFFEQITQPNNNNLGFPPLRGVMHAAGVLSDGILENQSWAKFGQTYNAKVEGSWNLHQLTIDLPLEHFVLFSSIAATFGSPGQSNHSGGNSYMDTLANYRTSLGLPATSINWGNWGEVGVATELDFPGISPIRTTQGIRALDVFLRTQTRRAVVANIDSFPMLVTIFPNARGFVDDTLLSAAAAKGSLDTKNWNADEFWGQLDRAQDGAGEKLDALKNLIKTIIRNILRLEASDGIEDHADFTSLGVDSLMMLELKNGLQNVLGCRLTISSADLKDGNSAAVLATRLLKLLEGSSWQTEQELPSFHQLKQLIRQDSILPESITPGGPLPPRGIDQVEVILLTGATGNLGPYLLRELSQRETISRIICLIRAQGKACPMTRLKSALEKFRLTEDEVNMSKVEVLLGNITQPRFGLSEVEYERLGSSVEAVFHSAVRGDHDAKYWKAPESNKDNIRTVNIGGTLQILQFCTQFRQKHLYYASTLLAVGELNAAGGFSEEWQGVGAFDSMTFNWGYPLTKHVAEQLVRQGVERGLSCKTFRFPVIGGDSRDGRCEHQNSHFMLRWLAALKLGAMPDSRLPLPYIPVDDCARMSLAVFFNPEAGSDVYSLNQVVPDREVVLVDVAWQEFGISVNIVSSDQFLRLIQAEDDSSPLAPFRRLYTEDQFARNVHETMSWLAVYDENRESFFTCEKVKRWLPGFEEALTPTHVCLRRDLRYLEKAGVFRKFGIVTKHTE